MSISILTVPVSSKVCFGMDPECIRVVRSVQDEAYSGCRTCGWTSWINFELAGFTRQVDELEPSNLEPRVIPGEMLILERTTQH